MAAGQEGLSFLFFCFSPSPFLSCQFILLHLCFYLLLFILFSHLLLCFLFSIISFIPSFSFHYSSRNISSFPFSLSACLVSPLDLFLSILICIFSAFSFSPPLFLATFTVSLPGYESIRNIFSWGSDFTYDAINKGIIKMFLHLETIKSEAGEGTLLHSGIMQL